MLDAGKSDHSVVALGVVAQTPCDVIANLNLHTGSAEVDIASVIQFKAPSDSSFQGGIVMRGLKVIRVNDIQKQR